MAVRATVGRNREEDKVEARRVDEQCNTAAVREKGCWTEQGSTAAAVRPVQDGGLENTRCAAEQEAEARPVHS